MSLYIDKIQLRPRTMGVPDQGHERRIITIWRWISQYVNLSPFLMKLKY